MSSFSRIYKQVRNQSSNLNRQYGRSTYSVWVYESKEVRNAQCLVPCMKLDGVQQWPRDKRERDLLPTYPHTDTTDSKRHKVSDHNAQTNGYIFYKTDFLPLSYFEGKKLWKKGKEKPGRIYPLPVLWFQAEHTHTHTIIIIIITQIKREKKKSIRFLFPFSLALLVANNNSPFCHK